MIERDAVHEGMIVRGSDGKKLGSVLLCREEDFIVEKHAFRTTDYLVSYDDVADISGGEVLLSRARGELTEADREHHWSGAVPESYGDEGGAGRP